MRLRPATMGIAAFIVTLALSVLFSPLHAGTDRRPLHLRDKLIRFVEQPLCSSSSRSGAYQKATSMVHPFFS